MRKDASQSIYDLIRRGQARTQREIEALTGLSRGTATQRLNDLLAAALVIEADPIPSEGGRPARGFAVNPSYRNVIGVDIGERLARAALFDLGGTLLDEELFEVDLRRGPEQVLGQITEVASRLRRSPKRSAEVAALGLSLPAPIDFGAGRVAMPSVMPGWEQLAIRDYLAAKLALPVALDNDVNLMCLAEHRRARPGCTDFVFIKAGTGIGCGIITGGQLLRGSVGIAGDIGHIQHSFQPRPLCRCGKEGCTEAHAAGWAIARDLRVLGYDCWDARDVMDLWYRGEPEALAVLNRGSRVLGKVTADLVAMLNPEALVIGGQLARAGEAMLAGVRELIYQRCLPLATERLTISLAQGGEDLGVEGAAILAIEAALAA